jgi:hypothetical protein
VALHHAGSTSVIVFVEEHSLSWQFMLQKVGINITCQTLQENVQTNDVVTIDTTPNIYVRDVGSCF